MTSKGIDMGQTDRTPSNASHVFAAGEFEWIEKAAIENLKGRRETADILAKEAATTLTILLAGVGGSLAYGVKVLDGDMSNMVIAAAAVCVWLTVLAMVLVLTCLKIKGIPAVYNQPGELLKRGDTQESFDEWRRGELENIQQRIEAAVARNDTTARYLNGVRIFAVCTPFIAVSAPFFFGC
jgi:hypothetical protein